jgi:hypothetical protein
MAQKRSQTRRKTPERTGGRTARAQRTGMGRRPKQAARTRTRTRTKSADRLTATRGRTARSKVGRNAAGRNATGRGRGGRNVRKEDGRSRSDSARKYGGNETRASASRSQTKYEREEEGQYTTGEKFEGGREPRRTEDTARNIGGDDASEFGQGRGEEKAPVRRRKGESVDVEGGRAARRTSVEAGDEHRRKRRGEEEQEADQRI